MLINISIIPIYEVVYPIGAHHSYITATISYCKQRNDGWMDLVVTGNIFPVDRAFSGNGDSIPYILYNMDMDIIALMR